MNVDTVQKRVRLVADRQFLSINMLLRVDFSSFSPIYDNLKKKIVCLLNSPARSLKARRVFCSIILKKTLSPEKELLYFNSERQQTL